MHPIRLSAAMMCALAPLGWIPKGQAAVVINEFVASAPDRVVHHRAGEFPRLGLTTPWQDPTFDDSAWALAPGPFGFGAFSGVTIATDTSAAMQGRVPSLYLRRTLSVTTEQAASGASVRLIIRCNDGFIAFFNGVEIARRNLGPTGYFVFHDQPAFNANAANASVTISVGTGASVLRPGENVLCIQAHNVMNTAANAATFLCEAALEFAGSPATALVRPGDAWRMHVGATPPSGGVVDHGLLRLAGERVLWASTEYNDFLWPHGPGPVGYDTANPRDYVIGTDLQGPLLNRRTSVYTRALFTASDAEASSADGLVLELDYDDGVIVYLNGREVARRHVGADGTVTPHSATADTAHSANGDDGGAATGQEEVLDLGPAALWLAAGDNVLGVQLHNASSGSSDLIARVTLRTTGATARTLVAPTDRVRYFVGDRSPHGWDTGDTEQPDPVMDASEDWIELRNDGATAVDLTGWSLTDNASNLRKWNFPEGTTIPAGGYLVVMATQLGLGPADGTTYVHADFSLSAGGEYLGLVDADGVLVDSLAPAYPPQSLRHAYGRDAADSFVYLADATPGAANPATGYATRLPAPDATPAGGFHDAGVNVVLTAPEAGSEIRYTLDGSDPTATAGLLYTTPLTVNTNTVVRAIAVRAGDAPSPVATHTFLIAQSAARRQLAAVVLSGDAGRVFYGPNAMGGPADGTGVLAIKGGRYVAAEVEDTWEANGDPTAYNIPLQRGRALEKSAHLEFFPLIGTPLRTGLGLRLAASDWSRPRLRLTTPVADRFDPWNHTQKPSFNLYFRNDFGVRPLEYPLIPDNPVTTFEDVRLRAGKNDIVDPFITDELMRRIYLGTGQQSSRGIFTTLYVNGVFKGFYNLCERIRDEFMRRHHGGAEEWDVRTVNDIESGDAIAWNRMMALLQTADLADLSAYSQVHDHLDVDNVIDYLLTNAYAATWDWPGGNWAAARERSARGRWRFYMWDAEGAFGIYGRRAPGTYDIFLGDVNGDQVPDASEEEYRLDIGDEARTTTGRAIASIYTLLRASPEFRLRWADRAQKHFHHGGALTRDFMETLWHELHAQVEPIIREETGVTISHRILLDWITSPVRRTTLFTQMRRYGLWVDTLAPEFSHRGGDVAAGATITITNPNGSGAIYYTLDGSDPRAPGGAVAGLAYDAPPAVVRSQALKARVLSAGGEWSPLQEAAFTVADTSHLLITELMYDPNSGNDHEFIELKNIGTGPAYLDEAEFTAGITFTFPPGTIVPPGAHLVIARDPAVFSTSYPGVPALPVGFTGQLSNSGERVTLHSATNRLLVSVAYGTTAPWPTAAAGGGHSLVPVHPDGNDMPDDPAAWRASAYAGGSPGADDPLPPVPAAIVAEPGDWNAADGHRTSLTVAVVGEPAPRFQWQISTDGGATWTDLIDGADYTGTIAATLRIHAVGSALSGAQFRVSVTNDLAAPVVSTPAQVTVVPPSRLLNLSIRAQARPNDGLVIAGLVVQGNDPARLLVRAVGPRLLDYDVSAPLADPQLEVRRQLEDGSEIVAVNDNWTDFPDQPTLLAAMNDAGAFPFGATDVLSAALVLDLAPGTYTALARGADPTAGIVLVEVYDLTGGGNRLVNLSSRGFVGHGEQVMIPGFVVHGDVAQTFLVRAVGPGLVDHGVPDPLSDPRVRIVPIGGGIALDNDDWGQSAGDLAELEAMTAEVGAFPLEAGSKDAAMLVTLPPGTYTVIVAGAGDETGIALVEVYTVR